MTIERFMARVERSDGCWLWRGNIEPTRGRGRYGQRWAHRVAYELLVGTIPDGHEIHHKCEQPLCVNPQHLEALSPAEHRKRHAISVCVRGHERVRKGSCRQCDTDRKRRARAAAAVPCAACGTPRVAEPRRGYADTGLCGGCYSASLATHPRGGWAGRR